MRKTVALMFTGFLLLLSITQVSADVSPPAPPSGTNPEPGSEPTNVRMVSETVLVEIDADSPFDNGYGKVTATFTMRNLGEVDEKMDVRFPLDQTLGWGNLCSAPYFYPTIDDIRIKVNGNVVSTQISYQSVPVITEDEPYPTVTIPCWANFPVTFPAGKDVIIQVTYTAEPYVWFGYQYSYVLETGRGWRDTIGSADIIFKVPYELNNSNFISCFPEDCEMAKNAVEWHYENFEPSSNVNVTLSSPPLWQRILLETRNTTRNPNDGEAWGRLGKAYKESIRTNRGYRFDTAGQEMYRLSKDAYQKAVSLLPNDADWHYGFADLLCMNSEYNNFLVYSRTEAWTECVEQVQQVLNLDPNHEMVKELIDSYVFEGMIDFNGAEPDYLILTPQPTTSATSTEIPVQATETLTAKPSATAQITKTGMPESATASTPTPIPGQARTESNALNAIGGAILLLIAILLVVKFKKA